jgi:hypothetical protein
VGEHLGFYPPSAHPIRLLLTPITSVPIEINARKQGDVAGPDTQ